MFKKHVSQKLSAYCNGELGAEESQRLREHLVDCERCRKEYDDVKLGVSLAQHLPLVSAPAEMWDEIEALLEAAARRPVSEPNARRFAFAFNWYRVAAATAAVAVITTLGVIWYFNYSPSPWWKVTRIAGTVTIDGDHIGDTGRLAVGETLETDNSSRAQIFVAAIGEVDVDPNTRIRLVETKVTEHRLALNRGRISARISAPPRLFFVDTPSAQAIDLGCEYTLEVDDAGRGLLHVTLGWVALVRNSREVYVPRYAMCQTRLGVGPGTPYFEDASETFVRQLERFDFEGGAEDALKALLAEARPRDTFTLWHLLSRVDGDQRVQVLNRMIELVGLPKGVTREGTLQLDQKTLDAWKDEMDTVWF